eukprot:4539624-Ditylum_brightwellii.AAC.1
MDIIHMNFADFGLLFKDLPAFKEFCEYVLCIIMSKAKMATMGVRLANDIPSYLQAVTTSNEQFALMIFDNWWELWECLVQKRIDAKEEEMREHGRKHPREKQGPSSGRNGKKKTSKQYFQTSTTTPGDPRTKIPGSNMTCYSMWGKFCPHTKGFGDGYPALMGMRQSLEGMIAHCLEVKKD